MIHSNGYPYEEEIFARHAGECPARFESPPSLCFWFRRYTTAQPVQRVNEFTVHDYQLLVQLLRSFRALATTPHVLTEVSNLANSLPEHYKYDWFTNLALLVSTERDNVGVREYWTPAKELANSPEFVTFGVTDSALTRLAAEALIVTTDYRLWHTTREGNTGSELRGPP